MTFEINKTHDPETYAAAYREMIRRHYTVDELNEANHFALEAGLISIAMFQSAARVLAQEILNRPA